MHQAKGDRFVRASELPVCDNEFTIAWSSITIGKETDTKANNLSQHIHNAHIITCMPESIVRVLMLTGHGSDTNPLCI